MQLSDSKTVERMTNAQKFEAFVYLYLTRYLKYPFAKFHREWFNLVFKSKRLAIAAPRNFAKSSILSIFYPIFQALEKPGSRIVLVSATIGFAIEKLLAPIKKEFETNEQLKEDYGNQVTSRWSGERIWLANGSSIEAKGAEGQIRGLRADLVIVDDIEEDEAVWSEDQRRKLNDWFWRALVGTLEPEAQLIVVGTLLHPLSFLAELVNSEKTGWTTRIYKALDENGQSNWPQRWPTNKLLQKREEIGQAAFNQEYMNDPIPEAYRVFKKADLHYYDSIPRAIRYTITIDPAATVKARSDYTAISVVGTDPDGIMYVADYTRKKMLPNEILDEIFRLNDKYHPHCIGIETVGFQSLLKYIFEIECRKRSIYPNIQELKLDVSERGRNKRFRIESLQPYLVKGKMLIGKNMSELEGELLSFPTGKHDDLIDALSSQLEIVVPAGIERMQPAPANSFIGVLQRKRLLRRKVQARSQHTRGWGV